MRVEFRRVNRQYKSPLRIAYKVSSRPDRVGGDSRKMAPAFVVGQLCGIVDLDGPLLAVRDVPQGIRYGGAAE